MTENPRVKLTITHLDDDSSDAVYYLDSFDEHVGTAEVTPVDGCKRWKRTGFVSFSGYCPEMDDWALRTARR